MSWTGRGSFQNDNSCFRKRSASVDRSRRSASSELRSGIPKPRSSSEERSNIYSRWSGSRKSSVVGDAKALVKDPRPLNDKSYLKAKLTELVEYLQATSYAHPLTSSKLMTPNKKDFETIFQHLVTFWIQEYVVKRIEEEAPKILKDLAYPFIPSKQTFVYVARTNWSQLLGVLLFLMDVAKFGQKLDAGLLFSTGDGGKTGDNSLLFEYIINLYFSKDEDEAKVKEVFTNIIRSRLPGNVDQLQSRKEELQIKMENAQSEIDKINSLKKLSHQQDIDIQKYKEYFQKMKEHKQKKELKCQQISEELAKKKEELNRLQKILQEKQAIYDAQGFDGKKQRFYYETQQKELSDQLQSKKDTLKKLQSECWEVEMQYTQTLDKGNSTSQNFNKLYTSVSELSQTVLEPLKSLKDPQIDSLCSNYNIIFPDREMQSNKNIFAQGNFLEEIKRKMDSISIICKGLVSKQNQLLHEIQSKKSELCISLKVAKAQKDQKRRDLDSKEKHLMEEWKKLEAEYDKSLKLLESIQEEKVKVENEYKEKLERLHTIQNLKEKKQKMLDDYLIKQKETFSRHTKYIEETQKSSQESGEEIFKELQKYVKE